MDGTVGTVEIAVGGQHQGRAVVAHEQAGHRPVGRIGPGARRPGDEAEAGERVTQIDEISDRNYRLAMENPEVPRSSVAEKFTAVRYAPNR